MAFDELGDYFNELADQIKDGLDNDVADIVGTEAVNHYKDSFQNEGFTDQSIEKWVEVKRRQGEGKSADASRKLLTGRTGALADSISFIITKGNRDGCLLWTRLSLRCSCSRYRKLDPTRSTLLP